MNETSLEEAPLDDFSFFTGAISCLTGSLNLQKALVETFSYLEKYFPIDAISLHQYSTTLHSLKLLFLVQKDSFDFVELLVPIPEEEKPYMSLFNKTEDLIHNVGKTKINSVATNHSLALSKYIPHKDRAYLICVLRSGGEIVGHLCLIGKQEDCFTKEHERKLALLHTAFSLAMANLLQYKRTTEFQEKLYAENKQLQKGLNSLQDSKIIGEFTGLKENMRMVRQLRNREITALILGETGTGKELIADAIQHISKRKNKPFVKVNCGAIPLELIDSELFGYEKGAFTGATMSHPGRFEQAHGGTLFLDEIGELPLQAQVRLLRVLQSGVVERLGSTRSIPIDVRIIVATNRNLELMMQEGRFREDLYYRIYVFPIKVPPLRERTADIPELVHFFLQNACDELGISAIPHIPSRTFDRLVKYSWPGNVRELENLVRRALTLNQEGPLLLEELLPQDEGWYLNPTETQNYFEKSLENSIEKSAEGSLEKSIERSVDARVKVILGEHLSRLGLFQNNTEQNMVQGMAQNMEQSMIFGMGSNIESGMERNKEQNTVQDKDFSVEKIKPLALSALPPTLPLAVHHSPTAPLPLTLDEAIQKAIEEALRISKGKINGSSGAAQLLAMNPNTLRSRMRKMGISHVSDTSRI